MNMDYFIIIMTIMQVDTNLIIVSQTYGKSCIKFSSILTAKKMLWIFIKNKNEYFKCL